MAQQVLVMILQESEEERETGPRSTTTILGLLIEKMDGLDEPRRRKKSLKERLGLKGLGCCGGSLWALRPTAMSVRDDDEGDVEIHHQLPQQQQQVIAQSTSGPSSSPSPIRDPNILISHPACTPQTPPTGSPMNLAAALAAERHFRASSHEPEGSQVSGSGHRVSDPSGRLTAPGTPFRVSLMRLLEETDEAAENGCDGPVGSDTVCCVCMGRKKGAAFIPCGHTYCRVCSRELWLNRGSCPLCNRPILEILDIF